MAKVVKEGRWYECSNCGSGLYLEGEEEPDWIDGYCPYCGEKFEEDYPYTDWEAKRSDDNYDDRVAMDIIERWS